MRSKFREWIYKERDVRFFTLDELEDVKKGVLLLDSSYFKIFSFTISKELDERERELEIEERLEELIEDYDNLDFLDKEIILSEDERIESILIIMIERDKIENLLENVKGVELLGVYPLFFVEFFNEKGREREYVEIGEERTRVYTFSGHKLINFQELEMERDEIVNYLGEYLEKSFCTFTYQEEITEIFSDIELRDWREYKLYPKIEYDFLPSDYHHKITYKRNLKLSLFLLSLVIILGVIFFFSFEFMKRGEEKKLNLIYGEYRELKEKNIEIREKIQEIEEEIRITREENRERDYKRLKVSEILLKVVENSKNISIFKIIFDGERYLALEGVAIDEESIYKFQQKILETKHFKGINQDYIMLKDGKYSFYIDIEVAYELE